MTTVQQRRLSFPVAEGKLYINGQWRPSHDGRTRPIINPATEEEVTRVAEATASDVEEAIASASKAFTSAAWRGLNVYDRAQLLMRIADLIDENSDELAFLETINVGKPITFSRNYEVPEAAQIFRYFAGVAMELDGSTRQGATPTFNYTIREPLGVVAAITPFNFPLVLAVTKIAPALAVGNTIVHKPASLTPLSSIKMAQILEQAGLPPGVYNLVTGPGGRVGDQLVTHPSVAKVAFTGSTTVGKDIMRKAADTVKRTTMELGGKSPNIIFADANLDAAAQNAFLGIYYNKGEICTAGSRLLVERSVEDAVLNRLRALIQQTKKGDPLDPQVLFGPVSSQDACERIMGYIQSGQQEGATLYAGGKRFSPDGTGKGWYIEPTIFTNVKPSMRIFQEEIFGPVLAVSTFESEEEAISLANNTTYGLASGIQTSDIKRAHRVAAQLQAGTVWINTYNMFDASTPFGGYKESGIGREGGREQMESYTQYKSVWVDMS